MRFKGQVRFEGSGAADLDVTVEVGDTHVRLDSGEESLGSWCLADVLAERLVANQFTLNLAGESVVFLAEDQVNFAYGAVQSMAEGWARYHAMNILMRRRAVSSARRRNDPSRLEEARQAFVKARQALLDSEVAAEEVSRLAREEIADEAAGATPPSLDHGTVIATDHGTVPKFWDKVIQARDETPEADPPILSEAPDQVPPAGKASPDVPSGEQQAPATARHARIRRLDTFPRRFDPGDDQTEGRVSPPVESQRPPQPQAEPRPEPTPPPASRSQESPEVEPESAPAVVSHPVAEPEAEPPTSPSPSRLTSRTFHPFEPGDGGTRRDEHPQVAIGTYADGRHPAETSGLRAILKERFGRSKVEHTHTMVQSTTAVGLTRNVCIECGYVSIGVVE
ncbi:hypothetical protein BH23ACT5_BH23ACT5_03230 [soil metagenome]